MNENDISFVIKRCACMVQRIPGSGLLESVYEVAFCNPRKSALKSAKIREKYPEGKLIKTLLH